MFNKLTFLLIATAGLTLVACGGGGTSNVVSVVTPVVVPAPTYLATDASCLSAFTAGSAPKVGKIDDLALYFGSFNVTLSLTGTASTFSIQSPGTATISGVTKNIASVCLLSSNGVNWRRLSFANSDSLNIDMADMVGAKPCVNGDNFAIEPPTLPGRFSGCKP